MHSKTYSTLAVVGKSFASAGNGIELATETKAHNEKNFMYFPLTQKTLLTVTQRAFRPIAAISASGSAVANFAARSLPSFRFQLLFLVLFYLAVAVTGKAHAEQSASPRVPLPQRLAPGVFAVIGATAEPNPQNYGAVANQGILIGNDGVILIDTGTSERYGNELIEVVRRLTSKPIVLAINTHQHPAFIFGNGALAAQGVPILAHRAVAELIEQRCETCLKNLNAVLGSEEMTGTRVTVPNRRIDGATVLSVAGRVLEVVYFGHSSSPGSIGVIDRKSGVLFAGGLVSIGRTPDTKDARISVWLDTLQQLKRRAIRTMVPGEGPVSSMAGVDGLAAYLTALKAAVSATYAQGVGLGDAAARSQLPAFARLPLYQPVHNKNVEQFYLALERATLNSP